MAGRAERESWNVSSVPEVEWRQAFAWDCPACGVLNHGELVTVDLQPDAFPEHMRDEIDAMRSEGMHASLEVMMMPVRVVCSSCKSRYRPKEEMPPQSEDAPRG